MKKESVFQSRAVLLIPFLFLAAAYACEPPPVK